MKARSAVAIPVAAIAIAVLAGCGALTAGTPSPAATVAGTGASTNTSASTSASALPPTTAPPVTITATPAPPVTVTATPPPVVIIPQAPVTVTQAPSTVYYPDGPAPTSPADQQVASDTYTAESVVGWWIPQLSSNTDSASAMAKFWSLQGMAGHYTDVFMVSSNDYTSFRHSGYYVTLIPRIFSTAAAANAWCDSEGFAIDNCLAKRLSHTDGPDGNTVERG